MIIWVRVVPRMTVCDDIYQCFDDLIGSHQQSQSLTLMMTSALVDKKSVNVITNSPS